MTRFICFVCILLSSFTFASGQYLIVHSSIKDNPAKVYITRYQGIFSKVDSLVISPSKPIRYRIPTGIRQVLVRYQKSVLHVTVNSLKNVECIIDASQVIRFKRPMPEEHYYDSIQRNSVYYRYFQERIHVGLPLDSLQYLMDQFNQDIGVLRKNHLRRYRSATLASFISLDSVEVFYYAVLIGLDYSALYQQSKSDVFRKLHIKEKLLRGNVHLNLQSNHFRKAWFLYLNNLYDEEKAQKPRITVAHFLQDYFYKNKIPKAIQDIVYTNFATQQLNRYPYLYLDAVPLADSLVQFFIQKISQRETQLQLQKLFDQQKKIVYQFQKGKPAPNFTVIDRQGQTISLSDFKGKMVLVEVWATWCIPCINEFPYLRKLPSQLSDSSDLVILSISTDEFQEAWLGFAQRNVVIPGLNTWVPSKDQKAFKDSYNAYLLPLSILIDKEGLIYSYPAPRASNGTSLLDLIHEYLNSKN
jgi:peroxiredoxin